MDLLQLLKLRPRFSEKIDPTPMALPIGYKKPPTMAEQVAKLVRSEQLRQAAESAGQETFEDADDFDVGDDYDPHSPYEETFETSQNADRLKEEIKQSKKPKTMKEDKVISKSNDHSKEQPIVLPKS